MVFQIHPPQVINESGKRKINEDNVFPSFSHGLELTEERLFLVCDGVGGEAKGEEASRLVCESFGRLLSGKKHIEESDIAQALRASEKAIDDYVVQFPDAKGMATTMTMLFLGEEGAVLAHLGDSRIYQLRQGEIIYQTTDHSLVQEMVSKNLITDEQARTHPKRNVITRVVMGSSYLSEPDIEQIKDVQAGDYFFLCTDGILESISNNELENITADKLLTDSEKMDQIRSRCESGSRDNFSAYLVHIESVEEEMPQNEEPLLVLEGPEEKQEPVYKYILLGLSTLTLIAIIVSGWFLLEWEANLEPRKSNTPGAKPERMENPSESEFFKNLFGEESSEREPADSLSYLPKSELKPIRSILEQDSGTVKNEILPGEDSVTLEYNKPVDTIN